MNAALIGTLVSSYASWSTRLLSFFTAGFAMWLTINPEACMTAAELKRVAIALDLNFDDLWSSISFGFVSGMGRAGCVLPCCAATPIG